VKTPLGSEKINQIVNLFNLLPKSTMQLTAPLSGVELFVGVISNCFISSVLYSPVYI
jgi:hypothetical protein